MHTELSSCLGTHLPEYIENVFGSALKLAGCLTRVHERGARFLKINHTATVACIFIGFVNF